MTWGRRQGRRETRPLWSTLAKISGCSEMPQRRDERHPHVYRVNAEPIDALVEPEAHGAVVDGLSSLFILPIQVWLFLGKEMKIVLAGRLIVLPCAPREVTPPVSRRQPVALRIIAGWLPDIPNTPLSDSLAPSRHQGVIKTHQFRLGFSLDERDSLNHACWSDV